MKMSLRILVFLACLLVVGDIQRTHADEPDNGSANVPSREAIDFFESKIRPLLLNRCIECHGDAEPEGEFSLSSREGLLRGGKLGPAVVPGKPKESLLISSINHDEFLKMPPKET